MALRAEDVYGALTSYVDESLQGMGVLKGSSCQVQNITDNADGTHTITFSWQDNAGQSHTSPLTVADGKDGKGIAGVTQSADGKSITVVYDDGTMSSPMPIPTEKGDNGKSAYDVAVENGFSGTQAEWLESLKGDTGADGADGQDGYSPSIAVKENTAERYTLEVTNKDGSFTTPNLRGGSGSGGGGGGMTAEVVGENLIFT